VPGPKWLHILPGLAMTAKCSPVTWQKRSTSSAVAHRPSWRVVYSGFIWLTMLLLSGSWLVNTNNSWFMCGRCLSICGNVDKSIPFIIGLLGSTAACALRVFMSACLDIQMQLHTLFIWLIVPLVMQLMWPADVSFTHVTLVSTT